MNTMEKQHDAMEKPLERHIRETILRSGDAIVAVTADSGLPIPSTRRGGEPWPGRIERTLGGGRRHAGLSAAARRERAALSGSAHAEGKCPAVALVALSLAKIEPPVPDRIPGARRGGRT